MKKIGILALQGNFAKHADAVRKIQTEPAEVREPSDLHSLDGLIIPGGESTTIGKLLVRFGLLEPVRNLIKSGFPVFGTCAGMILLAREIEGSDQPKLGGMNIRVARNAYGRQIESFEADIPTRMEEFPVVRGVFIRAPIATEIGDGVEVLAEYDGRPVILRQKNLLAISFHPELTDDTRIHEYFLRIVKGEV